MPKMFMSQFEATSNFSNNAMSIINTIYYLKWIYVLYDNGRTDQMIRPI